MDVLHIDPKLPERDEKGRFQKGSSFGKGNVWSKIYDKDTLIRQKQRVTKMMREIRGHHSTNSRAVKCSNGKIYPSASQAARELFNNPSLSTHITKCCKGKRYRVKGFTFEYYYDE